MPDDRLSGRRNRTRVGVVPFIWVEDADTGHRYDVPETAIAEGMAPVDGYEPNFTGRARPTKYKTDLAGQPVEAVRVEEPSGDAAMAARVAEENDTAGDIPVGAATADGSTAMTSGKKVNK